MGCCDQRKQHSFTVRQINFKNIFLCNLFLPRGVFSVERQKQRSEKSVSQGGISGKTIWKWRKKG